jgi:type IV secretory pathway VirB2 component (pilin)
MNASTQLAGASQDIASRLASANPAERSPRLHRRMATWLAGAGLIALSGSARAADVTASFTEIQNVLRAFAEFMTGPFGKAVVVISIIAAFCTWVFAPKDGIFGPILRVVVAGIAIMNAAVWVMQFGAGGTTGLGI